MGGKQDGQMELSNKFPSIESLARGGKKTQDLDLE